MTDDPPERVTLTGSLRHVTRIRAVDDHDVDVVIAPPLRYCGYSQCRTELTYDGKGRPPEYCPAATRTWPGGKTCKQMAAAERDGIRAAGLEAPLDEYAATTARLLATAGPLAQQLAAVLAAVDGVRDGALARVGDAERRAAEADERAEKAERTAQTAQGKAARAAEATERARAEVEEIKKGAAEVRSDAAARVEAATTRLAVAERERGEAIAHRRAAEEDRHAAEQLAQEAYEENTRIREQAAKSRDEIAKLRGRVEATDITNRALTQRIADQNTRNNDLISQLKAATEHVKNLDIEMARVREKNSELTDSETKTRVAAAAFEARATSAEQQNVQLLAALSDPARRDAVSKGPAA